MSLCFLGVTVTRDLKWEHNFAALLKKKEFRLLMTMMVQLYRAIIELNISWFAAAATEDKAMQQQVISSAERLMGSPLPSPKSLHDSRRRRVRRIMGDPSYPGLGLFFSSSS